MAEIQAEETYIGFIKWCKITGWWIVASFALLTMCNYGVDGSGSKYNGEVYSPMNTSK